MKKLILSKLIYSTALLWICTLGLSTMAMAQDMALNETVQSGWNVQSAIISETTVQEGTDQSQSDFSNDEVDSKEGLLVYPNPASDYVIIGYHAGKDEQILLELYDFNGKLISKKSDRETLNVEIDLSGVRPGAYVAKIRTNGMVKMQVINVN